MPNRVACSDLWVSILVSSIRAAEICCGSSSMACSVTARSVMRCCARCRSSSSRWTRVWTCLKDLTASSQVPAGGEAAAWFRIDWIVGSSSVSLTAAGWRFLLLSPNQNVFMKRCRLSLLPRRAAIRPHACASASCLALSAACKAWVATSLK
ncbi:Uncharacterised protein [Mycobacteroides abscessus subsp. abscessus]|nr:Uncharacterised protein [Mycobacteroides abscessus subsp. abscessus]